MFLFENIILKDIIKESGYKIEYTNKLHVKLLAVRSGLGKYGRNNICYIDDWGSMINLFAYFTIRNCNIVYISEIIFTTSCFKI